MKSLGEHLVLKKEGLVLLLTPPFAGASKSPGYIAGYPPGIRENGGQYTHAAAWAIMATAAVGAGDDAYDLARMMNPIAHSATPADANLYRVEPYVVAADVYSEAGHVGQGGWTWYTGSAGWLYRACLESILGLRLAGESLTIEPCIPRGGGASKSRTSSMTPDTM